jgi:mRNA-degrading endonuclease toxin of MazEF toxin-antitoxin module
VAAVMLADPEDVPFLPVEAELYWVRTVILWSADKKPTRPVVVIEAPATSLGRVLVVTRTTNIKRRGVHHEAMPEVGLTSCGILADFGSAEATLWTPRNARRLGILPSPVFSRVLERFG